MVVAKTGPPKLCRPPGCVSLTCRQAAVVVPALVLFAWLSGSSSLGASSFHRKLVVPRIVAHQVEQPEKPKQQEQRERPEQQPEQQGQQQKEQQEQPEQQQEPQYAKEEILRRECSSEMRERVQQEVDKGGLPPVMWWGGDLDQCGGEFVERTHKTLRSHPHFRTLLHMVPCDLYSAIQGRTLWLVGDSQQQRFYRQLRHFLEPFQEPGPRRRVDVNITDDPAEQEYIHSELLKGWDQCCGVELPHCTHFVGGTRVCHIRVNRGDHLVKWFFAKMHVLRVAKSDLWHCNFGLWHHKREGDYGPWAQQLADYVAHHRKQMPVVIWRDNSPQHFWRVPNGEFPHPDEAWQILGKYQGCKPMQGVERGPNGHLTGTNLHVITGGWRNQLTNGPMVAAGIHVHATWNDTFDMFDGHSGQECTHFCSPGAYNVWIWSLWRTLLQLQGGGSGGAAAPAPVVPTPASALEQADEAAAVQAEPEPEPRPEGGAVPRKADVTDKANKQRQQQKIKMQNQKPAAASKERKQKKQKRPAAKSSGSSGRKSNQLLQQLN